MWKHMFSMPLMRTVWRRDSNTSPRSTHNKHLLPHNHGGLIIIFKFLKLFKYFNIF